MRMQARSRSSGTIERSRAPPDLRIHEQGREPDGHDERHNDPVELQVEGQVGGKAVAPDRNEQNDRDDQPDEAVPAK